LPRQPFPASIDPLLQQIHRNRKRIELANETARREALIAPILFEIIDLSDRSMYVEYAIAVNEHLRGTIDYYIASKNLIVIEAKQADLVRGFTQLAVELIALDQWTRSQPPHFVWYRRHRRRLAVWYIPPTGTSRTTRPQTLSSSRRTNPTVRNFARNC
jgi:hypothetical protein